MKNTSLFLIKTLNHRLNYSLFSLFLFLFISLPSNAQSTADALRYSETSLGGTARGIGIAGAYGSLGGDFTSIGVNPMITVMTISHMLAQTIRDDGFSVCV